MIAHSPSIQLNSETIYLIEALKVESYWNSKNFTLTLQNKDFPFLNKIEEIVKKLGVKISKRILLKVKLENETRKEDVKILYDKKELNFHIEKSPFDNKKVKAVMSLPYKKHYDLEVHYKNKRYKIKIRAQKNKIVYESKLNCWIYGDYRFPTKKLLTFLDDYTGGHKNLYVEETLFNSEPLLVMSAFSALVDCEGSINWYGFKRQIQIRMKTKEYLLQWKILLAKLGVGCRVEKNEDLWGLVISGWEDFDKLERFGFKLYHSKKAIKWKSLIGGFKRNQISRNSYKEFYVNKLKRINKKICAKEFADYLNKSKRVVNHYLLKLEKQGFVSCDRDKWPYLYFISTSSVR